MAVSSWLWNQPRCWSDPSRHTSALNNPLPLLPTSNSSRRDHEVPLSNQTSMVSVPLRQVSLTGTSPWPTNDGGINSSIGPLHQYPTPVLHRTFMMCSRDAASRTGSSLDIRCKAGMGTPQTRCREMHHSERERMKDSNRFRAAQNSVKKSDETFEQVL